MRVSGAVLVMALCAILPTGSAHAGRALEIHGSTTVMKEILEPLLPAFEKETGTTLKLHGSGTVQGMLALLQGKVDVAMADESLEDALVSATEFAAKQGIALTVPPNLMFHELAKDRMLVIVNKHNPVVRLTRSQLKDIHTGKISNWQAVGGENLDVQVIIRPAGSGSRSVFQKQVMGGAAYAQGAQEVASTHLLLDRVSRLKGGIGVVSATFFAQNDDMAKFIEAPLLSRPLGLVTIRQPSTEVSELVDFARSGLK